MATFNVPMLGTEVKPVPQTSLGDMLNIARGAQQYQQAQQINPLELQAKQQSTRTGEIQLGVTEQADKERRNLQTFFADPNNFQTDGRIDIDKINAQVPKIAPLTGPDYVQKITTLGTAQTEGLKAKQNLTQDKKALISSFLGVAGRFGVDDPAIVNKELQNFLATNPNDPEMKNLVEKAYVPMFSQMQKGPQVTDALIKASQAILTPAQAQTAFAPTITPTTEGTAIISAPGVGIKPPTATATTVQKTDPYLYKDTGKKDPISNQPIYEVRDKLSNELIGQMIKAPQPEKQPAGFSQAPTIPSGESEETGKKYQDEIINARNSVQPAKTAINGIDTILRYLPLAQTGRASESIAGLESILGNLTGNTASEKAASARDIIQKNIADLGLQKNLALGGKFAASLESAERSLADAGKNPTAIISSMQQLRPLMQHASNYSTGLDKAIDQSPVKQYVKPRFDSAMNDAFDPLALQMKNAADAGKDAFTKFVKDNNLSIVKQQNLLSKLEAYGALVRGDLNAYQKIISGEK
jgi:hypothetical protein